MTYFADGEGLIYWALGQSLQERWRKLRVVLSYVPISTGGYRKCVCHGYEFELERLRQECKDENPDLADRVASLRRYDRRSGDQYLVLPRREVAEVFEPVGIFAQDLDKLLDPGVLEALRQRLTTLDIAPGDVRFYGRVACKLAPHAALGDVDIVLDQLSYRTRVEQAARLRTTIPLAGLDRFFSDDPHRLAAVKRRWSLSQLDLEAYSTTVQLDVKVAPTRPPELARLYYGRSWGRLQDVDDLDLEVTDASWALSAAPLLHARTLDGRPVSVSSKHYMFSGIATEGDRIKVTGVMDSSGKRIALTDPVKHFVVAQMPEGVRFE